MARENELALVKEIIADGYDKLDVISFELDIPMIELLNLKKQIEDEKRLQRARAEAQRRTEKDRYASIQKLQQLRRNYELIYNGISVKSSFKELPKVIPDSEVADEVIKKLEAVIDDKKITKKDRVFEVLSIVKGIQNENISLEQAERVISILSNRDKLPMPEGERNKTIIYTINKYKKIAIKKLVEAIKIKLELINDPDELVKLCAKLPYEYEQIDSVLVSPVKMRIQSKITRLRTEKSMYNMENVFSEDVMKITKNITSNDIDTEELERLVNNEVQRRMSQPRKGPFVLTEEKHKAQVYFQLVKALEKFAQDYPIQNPDKTIRALEKEFGMGFDSNFRAIILNYIARKQFVPAKYLCDKYTRIVGAESEHASNISRLKLDIQKAEIGQIILKAIHTNASLDEQNQFFEVIEKRMKQHGYNYSSIPLGYSKDGTRKITLADIWEDERIIR